MGAHRPWQAALALQGIDTGPRRQPVAMVGADHVGKVMGRTLADIVATTIRAAGR